MSNFTESAKAHSTNGGSTTFLVRWRGKQEGPYKASVIDAKLQANAIGLLHELFHNGQWVTVRDFLASGEAILRAERQAKEDHERQLREQDERRQREASEKAGQPALYAPSPTRDTNITGARSFESPLVRNAVVVLIALVCVCLILWVIVTLVPQLGNNRRQAGSEINKTEVTGAQGSDQRTVGSDAVKSAILARINSLESDYRNYSSELVAKQSEQAAYNMQVNDYFMQHKEACLALGVGITGVGVLVAPNKKNSDGENLGAVIAAGVAGYWALTHPEEAKEVSNALLQATANQQEFQKQVSTLQERKDATANQLKLERAKLEK